MANPMKDGVKATYADKFARVAGNLAKAEVPWERAQRISGADQPTTMPKPPNQAVPQFEDERSTADPPYGSTED